MAAAPCSWKYVRNLRAPGRAYGVTVKTQPGSPSQTCVAANGAGTVNSNVTNISITCTTNTFTIGGTISGLSGTVVLQNNAGNDLTLSTSGTFTFSTPVVSGGKLFVRSEAALYCFGKGERGASAP